MALDDLRQFIEALKREGELVEIDEPVDPELEITEITDRVSKADGPALLFRNAKGSQMPVLINQFGSMKRMSMALGGGDLDEIAAELGRCWRCRCPRASSPRSRRWASSRTWPTRRRRWSNPAPARKWSWRSPTWTPCPSSRPGPTTAAPSSPCRSSSPRTPTAGATPACTACRNSIPRTTGMHWHIHKDGAENFRAGGDRIEVAVAIGTDPATTYAATAPLPKGIDEMMLAGFLKGSPVEMVKCKTIDMEVPATAEIILEGYVEKGELRREGPFGDHTGYYSLAGDYPVFHLTCITHRRDPIYADHHRRPPAHGGLLPGEGHRAAVPAAAEDDPAGDGRHEPAAGRRFPQLCHPVNQEELPHARQEGHERRLGPGHAVADQVRGHRRRACRTSTMRARSPGGCSTTSTRGATCCITEGPLDVLDHSSPTANYGAKMGLDATKTWPSEGHEREWPDDIAMTDEIKKPGRREVVPPRDRPGVSRTQAERPMPADAASTSPLKLPVLFARFVKIEHSVFALPFAYAGAFLAYRQIPTFSKMFWITLVMVAARSLAMGLNRVIDHEIDARNPRTAGREIPAGNLSLSQGIAFCGISLAVLARRPLPAAAADLVPVADSRRGLRHLSLHQEIHFPVPCIPGRDHRAGARGRLDRRHRQDWPGSRSC